MRKRNFYPLEFIERLAYLYDRGLSIEDIALKCDIPVNICKGLLYYKTCSNPIACAEMRQEFLNKKYPSRNVFISEWKKKGFTSSFIIFGVYGLNAYQTPSEYKEFEFNDIAKNKQKRLDSRTKKFKGIEKRIKALLKLRYILTVMEENVMFEKNVSIVSSNENNGKIMSFKNKVVNTIALMAIVNSEYKVDFPDFVSEEERDRAINFVRSKIKTEPEPEKLEISNFGYYFLSNISSLMDNLDRPSKSEYIGNLVSYIKAYQDNFNAFIEDVKGEVKRRERKDNSTDECYKTFQTLYSSIYNNAKREIINSLKREIDNEEEDIKNEILKLIEKLQNKKRTVEKEVLTMERRIEELEVNDEE